MNTDKELKKKYKSEFSKNYAEFYPVETVKSMGFSRRLCSNCGKFFWSAEKEVCGDSACTGGYSFSKAKNEMGYIDIWKKFSRLLKNRGYTPVKRYPVVARWRDDIPFVEASIDAFIPNVTNGISEPPANPLTIPQLCLRFNDIDNVGITGAHYSLFVMIGQHAFVEPKKYDVNKYFGDLLHWFINGMKLKPADLVFHEDIWAGSGNFGPCMEVFSHGLELANQVYMQYMQTENGYKDLNLKVLDMGLGQERNAWFSSGALMSYESTFPTVCKKLFRETGVAIDREIFKEFLPYAGTLNVDESADVEASWKKISQKTGIDVGALKEHILPAAAIYAIGEHTRALLVAINDGALPSNVGGGYNLRILLRRALGFAKKFDNIDLTALAEEHARYLKPMFPELSDSIESFSEIMHAEAKRFEESRIRGKAILSKIINEKIEAEKLIELYESQGITPEMFLEAGTNVKIPEDFYARISEKHSAKKIINKEAPDVPDTKILYYEKNKKFTATVIGTSGEKVFLDRTLFYPTSGGQDHDEGTLNGKHVYDVQKAGNVIAHFAKDHEFKKGQAVTGELDWKRREQLASHHTAAHIINAAARSVLGKHVFQAGSGKAVEKAHLDVTHYKSISDDEADKIEKEANKIVKKSLPINKAVVERGDAEKKYGMNIYQGGAVPGRLIRIVEIKGIDVEACGGTHMDNTKDVGRIALTGIERIQDGVVRIKFVSGERAEEFIRERKMLEKECMEILGAEKGRLAEKAGELFSEWKKLRKIAEKQSKERASDIVNVLEKNLEKNVLVEKIEMAKMDDLQEISKKLSGENRVIVLFGVNEIIYVFGSAGMGSGVDVGRIISEACRELGGNGGGNKTLGQGFGTKAGKLVPVMKKIRESIENERS